MGLFLYHHHSSVCAAKVRIALKEKQLQWDGKQLTLRGDQFDPAYLKFNKKAVVPTLVHNDTVVTESNVILEYIEDAFPEPGLRPVMPTDRARMRLWLLRLDEGSEGIHHAISVLTYGVAYRQEVIKEAGSEKPHALRQAAHRIMNPRSRMWLDDVIVNGIRSPVFLTVLERMDQLLDDVEKHLAQNRWLAGSHYSLADVAYTPYIVRLELMHFDALWADRPRVAEWYRRLCDRSSMSEVLDYYKPSARVLLSEKGQAATSVIKNLQSQG